VSNITKVGEEMKRRAGPYTCPWQLVNSRLKGFEIAQVPQRRRTRAIGINELLTGYMETTWTDLGFKVGPGASTKPSSTRRHNFT